MNHSDRIDDMLNRYWDGESTLDEERALRSYFAQDRIDEAHKPYAPLFRVLQAEQNVLANDQANWAPPPVFKLGWLKRHQYHAAAAVMLFLSAWMAWQRSPEVEGPIPATALNVLPTEQPTQHRAAMPQRDAVNLLPTTPQATKRRKARKLYQIQTQEQPRVAIYDEAEEAQKAILETKMALELIAQKLQKGKTKTAEALQNTTYLDAFFSHSDDIDD